MADGAAKSIALPPEILEALGDYRDALKQTKAELKDLERQTKDAERKGVPVGQDVADRRLRLGARVERLQSRVAQQQKDKAALREASQGIIGRRIYGAQQRVEAVRTSLKNASAGLRTRGMGRAADLMAKAAGIAGRGGAALGQVAVMAAPLAAPVAAIAAVGGATVAALKYNQMMTRARIQGFQGEGQVADAMNNYAKSVAWGGSQAQEIGRFHASVMEAQNRGAAIGAAASLSDRLMSAINKGYSPNANMMSTKMALHQAERQQMIQQHGAIIQQKTSFEFRSQADAIKVNAKRDEKYGIVSTALTTAFRRLGLVDANERVTSVDIASRAAAAAPIPLVGYVASKAIDWAWGGEEAMELEQTKMEVEKESLKAMFDARKEAADAYQTIVYYAMNRALAHERSNAIRAYEQDKFTRSASWRL